MVLLCRMEKTVQEDWVGIELCVIKYMHRSTLKKLPCRVQILHTLNRVYSLIDINTVFPFHSSTALNPLHKYQSVCIIVYTDEENLHYKQRSGANMPLLHKK